MVAINEEDLSEYTSLTDNTWGLSLTKPEDENSKVYTVLSTDADNPTMITDKDYEETRENDTTTIYYGFYIAPGTPYGMYEGSAIYYETEAKRADLAKVIFDGNGKFYFDNDASITTNAISYMPGEQSAPQYSHTPNINDEGVQIEGEMYPLDSNETFVYKFDGMNNIYVDVVKTINDNYCGPDNDDYFSIWPGAHTNYTAKTNWETALSLAGSNGRNIFDNGGKYDGASVIIEGNAVTIAYTTSINRASHCVAPGYGYYAKVIGYNPNITVAGEYKKPVPDGAYKFLGWSEDPDATIPTYTAVADIERTLNLSPGNKITLYAISEPIFIVSYDGNDANADTSMDQAEQYTANLDGTSQVDLLAPNFTRDGYGFVGWSTDAEAWRHLTDDDETNNPIIYGPNQTITIDDGIITEAGENRKLALNAVWAPAETTASGDPVLLQDWQGCSRLTATTYNSTTSALTVGKNTITALTDGRDGNIYTIARLADGNCWMTESLRFDNESELSLRNTNNPSLPLTNDYNTSTTSNFLSATSDSWCTEWESAPCYNQSKLNTNNTVSPAISPVFSQDFTNNAHDYIAGDFNVNMPYYGNYYNWYSATAGNGKYETSSNQVVAGDVCPTGWQLPYGGSGDANNGKGNTSGGFYYLNQKMGGNTSAQDANNWRSFPNNFTYSGLWSGLTTYSRGYAGYYWSSTADTAGGAYSLRFYYDYVDPTNGNNIGSKNNGFSVRCILSAE